MAKTKIHGEYLDPSVISGQTQVTAVGADSMLIFDATDNALKKALLSDLIETVGSTPTFSQISSTGDLTIDAAGDIILDADGDDFKFQEGGTNIMSIKHESHGVDFLLSTTDEDFKFKGSDGGSTITALHLDISEGGAATFSGTINGFGLKNFGTDSFLISEDGTTGTIDDAQYNVGYGVNVFQALTSGDQNTGVGSFAFEALTTGTNNVAVGVNGLRALTTGTQNTTVGSLSLRTNTTGSRNTALGYAALNANTTAGNNTAIGDGSLSANTTGTSNTAVGLGSLEANTTADHNTGVGYLALLSNTTGTTNSAFGSLAGDAITTGSSNTALGVQALTGLTTGSSNTAVGKAAGENITTGSQNVILGGFTGNHQGLDVRTESDGKAIVSDGAGDIAFHNAVATAIYAGHVDVTGDSGSANAFALANGATVGLFGNNNNFSGVFILNDFTSTGEVAMFITGGGTISLVHQTGANFSLTSSPSSGQYGLYISGLAVKLVSNRGASASFRVCAFRTRNAQ